MLPPYKLYNKRAKIRLNVDVGTVVFRRSGLPSLTCTLRDLSEGGLQAVCAPNTHDSVGYASWKIFLSSTDKRNFPVELTLHSPPELNNFTVEGEVRFFRIANNGALLFGACFVDVPRPKTDILSRAVLNVAMQKLRGFGEPVDENGNANGNGHVNGNGTSQPSTPPFGIHNITNTMMIRRSKARQDPFRGKRLGEILVLMGKLTNDQVKEAQVQGRRKNARMGEFLTREGWITPYDLCQALSLQSGLPMVDLREKQLVPSLKSLIPFDALNRNEMVPFECVDKFIRIAAVQPLQEETQRALEKQAGHKMEVYLGQDDLIHDWLFQFKPPPTKPAVMTGYNNRRLTMAALSLPVEFQFCTREGVRMETAIRQGTTRYLTPGGFWLDAPALEGYSPVDMLRFGIEMRVSFFFAPDEYQAVAKIRQAGIKASMDLAPASASYSAAQRIWTLGLEIVKMDAREKERLRASCINSGFWRSKSPEFEPVIMAPDVVKPGSGKHPTPSSGTKIIKPGSGTNPSVMAETKKWKVY
jgi:hypothetical protein